MTDFRNIEPRYRQDEPQTNEAYETAKAEVGAAFAKLFPKRKYVEMGGSSVLLHVSNGTPDAPQGMCNKTMSETSAGRAMLAKARRDIETHKAETDLKKKLRLMMERDQNTEATVIGPQVASHKADEFERLNDSFGMSVVLFSTLVRNRNE